MRILSFLLFCITVTLSFAAKEVDFMFCAFDTGDSNMMRPVIARLRKHQRSVVVVAFGRGKEIFKADPGLHISEWGAIGDRSLPLAEAELQKLRKEFVPRVVVAGMASRAQAQVLNVFPTSARVALYDNFDPPHHKEFIQPFLHEVHPIDLYVVPAKFLVASFKELVKSKIVEALGQPALEEWDDIFRSTDRTSLRAQLHLSPADAVIVFAGGMEDTYRPHLQRFLRVAARHPEWRVFITYHPKSDGSLERAEVKEAHAVNAQVIDDIKTHTLATLATVLVCHKSSVCQQAFSAGVLCAYVAGPEHINFLIERRLVPRFDEDVLLEDFLTKTVREASGDGDARLRRNQETMLVEGIPPLASVRISDRLMSLL